MSGKVVHFEIPVEDERRATGFYATVFGWQHMAIPEMGYTLVTTGPTDPDNGPLSPGFVNGGMFKREEELSSPVVVIDVPDIGAALARVTSEGGSVVRGREAVGDMGFVAYFKDTEGNLVGLWEVANGREPA